MSLLGENRQERGFQNKSGNPRKNLHTKVVVPRPPEEKDTHHYPLVTLKVFFQRSDWIVFSVPLRQFQV